MLCTATTAYNCCTPTFPCECADRAKKADLLEDSTGDLLWRWELKSLAGLDTLKPVAVEQRAWRKKVRRKQAHSDTVSLLSLSLFALPHTILASHNPGHCLPCLTPWLGQQMKESMVLEGVHLCYVFLS